MSKIIIHSPSIDSEQQRIISADIPGKIIRQNGFHTIDHEGSITREQLTKLSSKLSIDINPVPENFQSEEVALIITDMDSTLISIECIDEIADFLNIKAQVAEVTESAMRGEIDFNTSLKKRVKLLAGLNYDVLNRVYEERLKLNPGAEQLVAGMRERGIKTALVSGGFTFFTDRLKKRLNLDYTLSNTLEVINDKLTGNVIGNIVNGDVKAGFLQKLADEMHISVKQAIAAGDGANDLPMLSLSGLGVAYHAKPLVQQKADVVINYAGLDAILDFVAVER